MGKSKAKFFRMHGFNEGNVERLEQGLLRIACEEDVVGTEDCPYGTKYTVRGGLRTPLGRMVELETVWIIESGDAPPRFVTAYPA